MARVTTTLVKALDLDLSRQRLDSTHVIGDKTTLKAHPGNDITQNPSDPDATRDGHRGPGYQAQIAETCSEENEVQLAAAVGRDATVIEFSNYISLKGISIMGIHPH